MYGNASNTVCVKAVKSLEFLGGEVVGLVLVADDKNNDIVFQEMDIVAFVGLLTHDAVEADVSSAYFAVFNGLLNVTSRVKLVGSFCEDYLWLVLISRGFYFNYFLRFGHQFQL